MRRSEITSFDPCTDAVVGVAPETTSSELERAIAQAWDAFASWGRTPLAARRRIALEFADQVRARRDEIARLIARETGKPFWECLTEADSVAAKVEISIRAQTERAGDRAHEEGGVRQVLRHRPHGVVSVIGPFNFPMHLANGHIVPALLAGNAVIFKPSEKTPMSGLLMAAMWAEAGLPRNALQVVIGTAALGRQLVAHPGIEGVFFTGGLEAGRAIHRALAGEPQKILALELGGNNPLVIWDAPDPEEAAHIVVQSAFISAGQRCSCARRLILPASAEGDAVVEALQVLTDRLIVSAPFDTPQPYMGPVIDNAAAERLLAAWSALERAGGEVIRPLQRLAPERPFLHPGVIDVTAVAERQDEEHFGPLLQVVRVPTFAAALKEASATRFGLAAGFIGARRDRFEQFATAVRAGVVNWNRPTTGASSGAPFGGVGASGNHRPSAFYAADYCAFPVAGLESPGTRFQIGAGLRALEAAQ
jgi:succinylglutamic semialdehyde dehydrogenase